MKDWNREDAIKTGAKILSGKMVDDAHKEKSRYCAREFATFKDPSVFAAASDVDNTSLIDLLAVKRGHGIMCFDAVAAFCQAPETELIFIEAPEEHRAVVGQHVLWQCLKVREGRRKGARAWQEHFIETLLSQDCPGSFKQSLKSPTIFYSSDFETALDLHVDDGYMTGPAERMMQVFAYLEGVIILKLSPIIGVGDSFEHVGALKIIDIEGMWVKELDKYETSVLTMMQMKDCRTSTSPKLEKQTEPGDDDPCEHPELHRSAVCTILYMTKRRPDLQATMRWMCKRLRNPNQKSWRQLVKTVRYIKGSRDLATFMPKAGKSDIIEAFFDGDWACDDLDRKSASGGYLMVGGCRLHSHSRTTGQHALSSGESEIRSMSEVLKEAKLMQYNLEFCGMGLLPIVRYTDEDVARAFCHKRDVGRMKHLDVRHCWLQEELEKGNFKVKRVDRKFNASDMLTHSPSAEELRKFLPMIGCHTMTVNRENYNAVKTMLKAMPAAKVTAFLTSMADVAKS